MIQEKIGQAVASLAATPDERLVGVIPDVYKGKTFGGKESFNVIITTNRLIFIHLQPPEENKPSPFFSSEKYTRMTTSQITAENKKNIVLEKDQLNSVRYTPGHSYVDCCRKVQEIDGELGIVTSKAKYSLNIPFRRTPIASDVLGKSNISSLEIIKKETESEKARPKKGSCCSG